MLSTILISWVLKGTLARLKGLETLADLRQSPGVLVPLGWKLQRVGEQKTPLYAISRDMNT